MDSTVAGLLIVNGVTLLSTIGGFLAIEIRARRERQWAKEDREVQTKKIEDKLDSNKAEVLAQTVETVEASRAKIAEVHAHQKTNATKLGRKIDDNTRISVKAFNEANHLNEKIAAATERAAALEGRFDGLEHIIYELETTLKEAKSVTKDSEDATATDLILDRRQIPATLIIPKRKPRR